MKIAMIGTGYVGLVSGACFAETGQNVVCVDTDLDKIRALRRGESPIFEPGLPELLERNLKAHRLSFTPHLEEAIDGSAAIFLAVGTPSKMDGGANLSGIIEIAEAVRDTAREECVLVIKSTVPVGTNARIERIVEGARAKIHVASNPEFLKEGAAIGDFMRPDRIVIGLRQNARFARDVLTRLYHPVTLQKNRIVWTSPESAELSKYVSNTMLAMRISFMNEIASLSESVGANIHEIRRCVGGDTRIGPKFLYAGPGYGGSCFPKDVRALIRMGHDHGIDLELAAATERVNHRQRSVLSRKLRNHFGDDLRQKRIAVWGLSFKPNTDDIRESPAIPFIENLRAEGASIVVHDPEAMPATHALFGDTIDYAIDAYHAAQGADALILITEWRPYQNPNFRYLIDVMRGRYLLDGRNIWSGYRLEELGFIYEGIGVKR